MADTNLGPVRSLIRDVWRPRTEMGRQLKHKLLYLGEEPPEERQNRRW